MLPVPETRSVEKLVCACFFFLSPGQGLKVMLSKAKDDTDHRHNENHSAGNPMQRKPELGGARQFSERRLSTQALAAHESTNLRRADTIEIVDSTFHAKNMQMPCKCANVGSSGGTVVVHTPVVVSVVVIGPVVILHHKNT
jgi:hypothetical protein